MMSKISLVSRQILAVVEMMNWFFGSRVTPSVDLNEILQYPWMTHNRSIFCVQVLSGQWSDARVHTGQYLQQTS
jgi:hypothetical protein